MVSGLNQKRKEWRPLLTPKSTISYLCITGLVFVGVGIVLLFSTSKAKEYSTQYDGKGSNSGCELTSQKSQSCVVNVDIKEKMEGPVYIYYQLDNFFQNHRVYLNSIQNEQMMGRLPTDASSNCDYFQQKDGRLYHPCGLIAHSFFNDTFNIIGPYTMNEQGIAWESDVRLKFKKPDLTNVNKSHYIFLDEVFPSIDSEKLVEDEHFIVWMRTEAFPTFRKLYGIVEQDVPPGTLSFNVSANFNVNNFSGKKSIVVMTTSWLGGPNMFLAASYLVVGMCMVAAGLTFLVLHKTSPRELGDRTFLEWSIRE